MPDVHQTFPPGTPGVTRQDVLPGSFNVSDPYQQDTGVRTEPSKSTDILSQFTDASPEQIAAFQQERDRLYASMMQRVEVEVDKIIKTLARTLEVRERELVAALQQAKQAGYPVPANLTLPWFKHGLRGFLRKIWYGSSPDNPDWKQQMAPQSSGEESFIPRKTESTIVTLEEQLYIERGINGLVDQYLPINEAEAIDSVLNAVSQLKQNLMQVIRSYLNRLYHTALTHGISLKGAEPREEPPKKATEPVAGPATAVAPKVGDVRMNPETGREEIYSVRRDRWVDKARSERSARSAATKKSRRTSITPEAEPDLFDKSGKMGVPPPRGRDVQQKLFDEPSSEEPPPKPARKPRRPAAKPIEAPPETPPETPPGETPARRKPGRPKGEIKVGDEAIEGIVGKTNRKEARGKPGNSTVIGLLRELAKRGVDIYDPHAVRHAIRQVVPEYRGIGSFLQTYAKKAGLDLEDADAVYQHLGIEPSQSASKLAPETPETPETPPEKETPLRRPLRRRKGSYFGPESGDTYENTNWARHKEGFIQKLRDSSTPTEKVRLFTRLLKEKS